MKNLSELQMELHRLSVALEYLGAQVEDLKEQEDHTEADYAALEELARRDPLENPALKALPPLDRERYFRLLTTAAGIDGPLTPEQLFYLCRLTAGAGEPIGARDLCFMAYQTDRLEWQAAASGLKPAGNPLVLDLLMTAGLNGPASDQTLEFIAETAGLLKIEEEDLRVISKLAASLLALDYQAFMDIHAKKSYNELGYLVPVKWIRKERYYCGYYWSKKEAEATVRGMKDFTILKSWVTITGHIDALRRIEGNRYVHSGQQLVSFRFVKDETYANVDDKNFEIPKYATIYAKGDGILHYVPCTDGSSDIWITSAFDTLENLPAVKHEEKKEE